MALEAGLWVAGGEIDGPEVNAEFDLAVVWLARLPPGLAAAGLLQTGREVVFPFEFGGVAEEPLAAMGDGGLDLGMRATPRSASLCRGRLCSS
ncbi:MAG: hypothetical protein ACRDZ7_09980 [Acidimicrobiia bacterium]